MPNPEQLASFVNWYQKHITGDEKGQAQIFLDRLFQSFGLQGSLDAGGSPEFRVLKSAEDGGGTSFADYVWKPVVLIEMKKRGENLQKHYRQAFDYWTRLVPNRPRYVVLCNFDEFWIYDFDTDLDTPKDKLATKDLPQRWGPLAFLANQKPTFENDREAVTREAADKLALCFKHITKRGVDRAMAQKFILQMLVALFAEDIGLLPKYFVTQVLDDAHSPAEAYDLIGGLFEAMNDPSPKSGGRFKGVSYFNGGLFAQPAKLELQDRELVLLRDAAKKDWAKVQPEIFGTLFQHSMDDDERHAFGAHYTSPADIMKIVGPTIVEPWREQIESAKTLDRLHQLRTRMNDFRVLDPACGSGNFLYIAYREMKRLEARLFERMDEFKTQDQPGQMRLSFLSAQNFYGMDILPFAVEIAKLTMMIARKLAIDELHITEQALPLDNLDKNFIASDALLTPEGLPTQWPKADVIIGNPPFLGASRLRPERGDEYIEKLRSAYPYIPGMADYCVYWFRKAADHLPACTAADPVAGRAGLVGTQNIRNNQSRFGGLDYIVKTGTIVEAVENQPWSGEANVNVSIANWVKTQDAHLLPKKRRLWFKAVAPSPSNKSKRGIRNDKLFQLDLRETPFINSALSDEADVAEASELDFNKKPQRVFRGFEPGNMGFLITPSQAAHIIQSEPKCSEVVRPYLMGKELVTGDGTPVRWVIDFGRRSILEAKGYGKAFDYVEKVVLPQMQKIEASSKDSNDSIENDTTERMKTRRLVPRLGNWWQLRRSPQDTGNALKKLKRYAVCPRVTKRPTFAFVSSDITPGDKLVVFALDDDYSYGVLQSAAHWLWFTTKCSKQLERFIYNPTVIFDTFPWPQFEMGSAPASGAADRALAVGPERAKEATTDSSTSLAKPKGSRECAETDTRGACGPLSKTTLAKIEAVAEAGREVRRVRAEALSKMKGGLRALYRTLELPGANPLKDAHAALDTAVLNAYGFSPKKDLLAQLLTLNQQVAERIEKGEPVTAPGIPQNYPEPKTLLTEDCVKPNGF